MDADPTTELSRLGARVRARREALGLSMAAAAREAGVARGTWISLEAGSRETHPHQYAAIEQALRWAPGSLRAIREGGDAALIKPADDGQSPTDTDWAAKLQRVRQIANNPDRSPGLRAWAAAQEQQIEQILAAARAEEEAQGRSQAS